MNKINEMIAALKEERKNTMQKLRGIDAKIRELEKEKKKPAEEQKIENRGRPKKYKCGNCNGLGNVDTGDGIWIFCDDCELGKLKT